MAGDDGRGVLEGGFRILRALPEADERRQMSSLAELTSIPRSTVRRLLHQLRRSKAVDLHPDGRWTVSPHLLDLAGRAQPLAGQRTGVSRVLQALRDQTGATVSLVVPAEASLVAIEMVPGREILPIDSYPGIEMPDQAAASLVLDPAHGQPHRLRQFAAAVDDQDLMAGLTCYARLLTLPHGQRAALQIATSARTRAENFAGPVQRAANTIEALASRGTGGH
ncbi:helix-turn-helix domain-containing protein [Amycolatopsis jejuensis]|uniref:helix-turn-helix domain-containing protein n=1 Tax=Amycolatopsis jejuensis TaxID=330084 RepID=UPI000A952142|nr:helix-turn-helix domain-containing protein [Amycolatopsis jejuensis]